VRGTLIVQYFRGNAIGPRLLQAGRELLAEKGVQNTVGLMLPQNYSSIIIYLRVGGLLCGIDHDVYGLPNFAHYTGDLADRTPGGGRVEASGINQMRELFTRGYVCRGLRWEATPEGRRPVFEMTGEFAR